jgi:hypothetical protein
LIRKSPQADRLPSHEHASGLIFGLIRLRSPTFIAIQINLATQIANVYDIRRTVIPIPENRKVSGSALPLATSSKVGKWCSRAIFVWTLFNRLCNFHGLDCPAWLALSRLRRT